MNEEFDEDYVEIFEERAIAFSESLPKVVREFQKDALEVSHMNDVPAAVSFFVLLGQIMKDFVAIPRGRNTEDTRIHFCWIQTSGTGKSTMWNFVSPISEGIFKRINLAGNNPNMVFDDVSMPLPFNNFSVTDYTDATLIGGFNKELDDEGNVEFIRVPGQLEGSGLAHWDEFEYSGIFKPTSHNEKSIVYLNTFMNSLHGKSWRISKALRSFDNEVMYCYSQRSTYAMTYPPSNLSDIIADKGVLQRMLLFIWDVPEHIQHQMRKEQIAKSGTIEEVNMPIDRYVSALYKLYELTRKQFEANGSNPLKTVTYADGFQDALLFEYENMQAFINNTNGDVRKVAQNFTTRLMGILTKMSVLCSIAESPQIENTSDRFVVRPINVRQAASIVRQCYSTLVDWLEQGLRVKRQTIASKSLFPVFVKVYASLDKLNEDGFVRKSDLIKGVEAESKKSHVTVYKYYNSIKDKFIEDREGRSIYVKLVGDEE